MNEQTTGQLFSDFEKLKSVAKRFADSCITEEETVVGMDVPIKTVKIVLR